MSRIFILAIALCMAITIPSGYADMVVFQNGERRFGDALIISGSDVILNQGAFSKRYKKHQVKDIIFGFDQEDYLANLRGDSTPADVDLDSVTEVYIPFEPTGMIYDITGTNVYRKKLTTPKGRSFVVDVEEYFDIRNLQVFPMAYGFFQRQGSFIRMTLLNRGTEMWHPLTLRIFLFGKNGLLQTRDVYVFRLPGNTDGTIARRVLEANFPDVPFEAIESIRVTRRF